jgi:hydroxymethylpyrimidine pyrophosphatase-like HAD family hydrolase
MNAVDASLPTRRLLLCTDLDRTLLPNGFEPESPDSRDLFARLVAAKGITLAYVSGRDQALVDAAIADYKLPQPDFAITDVGTRIAAHVAGVGCRYSHQLGRP